MKETEDRIKQIIKHDEENQKQNQNINKTIEEQFQKISLGQGADAEKEAGSAQPPVCRSAPGRLFTEIYRQEQGMRI